MDISREEYQAEVDAMIKLESMDVADETVLADGFEWSDGGDL